MFLSKTSVKTSDFINLGSASSTAIYTIPTGADLAQYKYVLIYCQQYSVLFGSAQLTSN